MVPVSIQARNSGHAVSVITGGSSVSLVGRNRISRGGSATGFQQQGVGIGPTRTSAERRRTDVGLQAQNTQVLASTVEEEAQDVRGCPTVNACVIPMRKSD